MPRSTPKAGIQASRFRSSFPGNCDATNGPKSSGLPTVWRRITCARYRRFRLHRRCERLSDPDRVEDRDIVREALTEIGGLTGLLTSSDPAERAHFYDAVGISGTYEPQVNGRSTNSEPRLHLRPRVGPAYQLDAAATSIWSRANRTASVRSIDLPAAVAASNATRPSSSRSRSAESVPTTVDTLE